jgi:hypothetical protein
MNLLPIEKESAKLHGINEKKKQGKVKDGKMKKTPSLHRYGGCSSSGHWINICAGLFLI